MSVYQEQSEKKRKAGLRSVILMSTNVFTKLVKRVSIDCRYKEKPKRSYRLRRISNFFKTSLPVVDRLSRLLFGWGQENSKKEMKTNYD